jgi:uncharacterized protein YidB (DUF937 family)
VLAIPSSVPVYRLADYLDQHGRRTRQQVMPPSSFWAAAVTSAPSSDVQALARAAETRGMLLHSARLRKQAATQGDSASATMLIRRLRSLWPDDDRPAQWVAARPMLDNASAVATLLLALREAGAHEQVATLLARDPATQVDLHAPGAVATLLAVLREAGAHEQVATLLARDPATQVDVGATWDVATLLRALREAGAHEPATELAGRAAAHAALHAPDALGVLLSALREASAHEQVATLLARNPAEHAAIDDPVGVAWLLGELRNADAHEQATVLADRAAVYSTWYDSMDALHLLDALREAGFQQQAAVLAKRMGPITLGKAPDVGPLIRVLKDADRPRDAPALAIRDPDAYAGLCNPFIVTIILPTLRALDNDLVAALLAYNLAEHTVLDNSNTLNSASIGSLIRQLREAGEHKQAATLVARLPAGGFFDLFREETGHQSLYRYGREVDGTPASAWCWEDLN